MSVKNEILLEQIKNLQQEIDNTKKLNLSTLELENALKKLMEEFNHSQSLNESKILKG